VHWLPSLLIRTEGGPGLRFYIDMIPAWRFGTPGFAMVFGMGVGALGLFHYQSNRALFLKGARFNTRLIVIGVLILAVAKFALAAAEGKLGDRDALAGLFYSAITYYALAMLTLPLMVRLLMLGPTRLLTIFAVGAAATALHEVLSTNFGDLQPASPVLEGIKITLTAKYGYFRMTGFVMVGVAIGWLFRSHHDDPRIVYNLVLSGLILIALGGVGVFQSGEPGHHFGMTHLWHLSVYAGAAVLILSGFAWLNRNGGPPQGWMRKRLNAFAIASGILALPIFVGHEVTLAIKQLLDALGVADVISLASVLTVFFGALALAYRRLWRLLVY
jgi:hypothetical protein